MAIIGGASLTPIVTKYEYEVIEHSGHARRPEELRHRLNELGKDGWLLITDYDEMLILARPIASKNRQAVTGTVSIVAATTTGGEPSMAQLTVDAAGVAKFQFDDDKGDIVGPPQGDGSGIVVAFSSDNPSVVSGFGPTEAGTDENGLPQYTASPTVVADGTYNLTAVVSNTSGAPLVDDDGATPFVQAASVPVTLAGGQATTGTTSEG